MLYRPQIVKRGGLVHDESQRDWSAADQNTIVVALNGDSAAEKALPHAVQLARRWGAPLHLVQVITPGQYWDGSESAVFVNSQWLSARQQAEAYLEGVVEAIAAANYLPVTAEIIGNISAESGLSSLSVGAGGLLVVAKPTRSTLSQFYFGSVTNNLIGRLAVPLLIVPAGSSDSGLANTNYQQILIPVDHGDVSEGVLNAAAAFASEGATCRLLHVFPLRAEIATVRAARLMPINLRQDALLRMRRAEGWLQQQNVNATSLVVDDWRHSPAQAILAQADAFAADLIVLRARRRILPWWLCRSVPEYVARHATRPVLFIPSDSSIPVLQKGDHVDFHSN
jgi:nucleotide-binding universal stress UspA family protein